ncbi:conserved hypothetical protein [Haliangium ochraceum DSM 14365]|uniref:CENP-V/GFA domain-containing protein n=1 Tax=Haliangium ochraceum (strain DSM 14365 / JCM 11303 / SMP-2) TaxID=502025 RepID=D0LUS6_HALO1|nr:conserved hypothetical protein [Haliangium ochraceum DSM 14365]
MTTSLSGSCHCGNLSLELHIPAGVVPAARACQCSFCRGRRARWTSVPAGEVVLAVADSAALSRYRFGTRTADFLVCARCGGAIAVACELEGSLYAVVNVDCIAALRDRELDTAPSSFDGEDVDARLMRRQRSWTPARWRPR